MQNWGHNKTKQKLDMYSQNTDNNIGKIQGREYLFTLIPSLLRTCNYFFYQRYPVFVTTYFHNLKKSQWSSLHHVWDLEKLNLQCLFGFKLKQSCDNDTNVIDLNQGLPTFTTRVF